MTYFWQRDNWNDFTWNKSAIDEAYNEYRKAKQEADIAFEKLPCDQKSLYTADSLAREMVDSSLLEGQQIAYDTVFSSVSRRLGLNAQERRKTDRTAENLAEIILDATENKANMTFERISQWHHKLFDTLPLAYRPQNIGAYRQTPVYVVRQAYTSNEIVYEAIPAERIDDEMKKLLRYINGENEKRALVKAAVVSFWFVIIHPFEDGNGRISRALCDYVIALGNDRKIFSISGRISEKKKEYYEALRKTESDLTEWLLWFIKLMTDACREKKDEIERKQKNIELIKSIDPNSVNSRQLFMLYKLADGSFYGKLTASKWCKMTKCTPVTASRDLSELVRMGILVRIGSGSRDYEYVMRAEQG